jgi:hypothetical protein
VVKDTKPWSVESQVTLLIGMIQIEIAIEIGIERDMVVIEALHFDFDPDFDSSAKNQPANFMAFKSMCYLRSP